MKLLCVVSSSINVFVQTFLMTVRMPNKKGHKVSNPKTTMKPQPHIKRGNKNKTAAQE